MTDSVNAGPEMGVPMVDCDERSGHPADRTAGRRSAILTLSPTVRLARATFISFAAMLAVFAVWALTGFGYPSAPVPFALNVVSKLLAFVTVLTLFLPQRAQPQTEPGPDTGQPKPQATG
jgi:hypothetical protein